MTPVTGAAPPALQDKERRLRDFLAIRPGVSLIPADARLPALTPKLAEHLEAYNLKWHAIPAADAEPFDDAYLARLYPRRPRNFDVAAHGLPSCRDALTKGHREHQGMAVAVETTLKPRYLPENHQCYGTLYGFDSTADPFAVHLRKAGFLTSTLYVHPVHCGDSCRDTIANRSPWLTKVRRFHVSRRREIAKCSGDHSGAPNRLLLEGAKQARQNVACCETVASD